MGGAQSGSDRVLAVLVPDGCSVASAGQARLAASGDAAVIRVAAGTNVVTLAGSGVPTIAVPVGSAR